jgi:hypothetical protein
VSREVQGIRHEYDQGACKTCGRKLRKVAAGVAVVCACGTATIELVGQTPEPTVAMDKLYTVMPAGYVWTADDQPHREMPGSDSDTASDGVQIGSTVATTGTLAPRQMRYYGGAVPTVVFYRR